MCNVKGRPAVGNAPIQSVIMRSPKSRLRYIMLGILICIGTLLQYERVSRLRRADVTYMQRLLNFFRRVKLCSLLPRTIF